MSTPGFKSVRIAVTFVLAIIFFACNDPKQATPPESAPKISLNTPLESPPIMGDPSFVVMKDTVSEQGPRGITRNVMQDRKGDLWFAAWDGLIHYDGKKFTNLTLKYGLWHFHIFALCEDHLGNIWFGMIGGGVYCFDGQSFRHFTTAEGLPSNVVMCLQEDSLGNIWVGTNKGLSRYDGSSFANFTTKDGLRSEEIYAMLQDKTGTLWFGTLNGVSRYDGSAFTHFTNENGQPMYNARALLEDKAGNIWIGSQDGLCRYDGHMFQYVSKHGSSAAIEDRHGNLWFSHVKQNIQGMFLSKYDGKSVTQIAAKTQVFGLTEDNAGKIWFGTEQGAYCADGKLVTGR